MIEVVKRRLAQWGTMSFEDHQLIETLKSYKGRCLPSRHLITLQGRRSVVLFVLRGWICRYGQLHDGRRQILSLMLPGDFVVCEQLTANDVEPLLHTLTETVLLDVPLERFESLCAASHRLAALVKRAESVQAATSREWVLSLGVRTAKERCAHLICEIVWRLRTVGLLFDGWFEFPLTQDEVGNAIGTTTVTVNKVLQDLRHTNLIEQQGRRMRIVDLHALESFALFDPAYLFLKPWSPPAEMLLKPSSGPPVMEARRP